MNLSKQNKSSWEPYVVATLYFIGILFFVDGILSLFGNSLAGLVLTSLGILIVILAYFLQQKVLRKQQL